jgi:hypothetical protein
VTELERHALVVSDRKVARALRAGRLRLEVEPEPRVGHPRLVIVNVVEAVQ